MSSSSETIIFMFLGVATVNNRHDWNTWFVLLTIIFCSVYRTIGKLWLMCCLCCILTNIFIFIWCLCLFLCFFLSFCIAFALLISAIGVIILSAIANRFRLNKLSRVDQFVMSYGGLRGAVAFALALLIKQQRVDSQPMFVTTTIAVIYFTVFLQGSILCHLFLLCAMIYLSSRSFRHNH